MSEKRECVKSVESVKSVGSTDNTDNKLDSADLADPTDSNVSTNTRHPLTPDHIFVVTELAKLGMAYLKIVLPEFEKELDGAGRDKRDHYAHLKSLYEVAGPETVRHFDEMCQFIFEEGQKKVEVEG